MRRVARLLKAPLAAALALIAAPAAAFECHTALVLALDASDSVDPAEADLQRKGIALALRDDEVRAAITPVPGVGVMMMIFEWADPGDHQVLARWTKLDNEPAIDRLIARIENVPSAYLNGQTGIGDALAHAAGSFRQAGVRCGRRVIDVSGDGPGNIGTSPEVHKATGAFDGVVINGLVIRHPELDSAQPPGRDPLPYYMERVRHGPGAFVELANTYDDYAEAIRRKLIRELTPSLAAR